MKFLFRVTHVYIDEIRSKEPSMSLVENEIFVVLKRDISIEYRCAELQRHVRSPVNKDKSNRYYFEFSKPY